MEQMGNATYLICVAGSYQPERDNQQPAGGWGVVIQDMTDHRRKDLRGRSHEKGGVFYMDLLGLLAAFQDGMVQPGASVRIVSTEQVLIDFLNKGIWKRQSGQWLNKKGKVIDHVDQWEQLAGLLKQYKWMNAEKIDKKQKGNDACSVGIRLASNIAQSERKAAKLRV